MMAKRDSQPRNDQAMGIDDDELDTTTKEKAAERTEHSESTEGAEKEKPAQTEVERGRQGAQPVCPWHHVQCVAHNTKGAFTYYKCPAKGCQHRTKVIKPALVQRFKKTGKRPE